MLLVGWQLWQLSRNLKAGVFGSRLAVRLVLLFALVAVLPGALVYAVSVQFLGKQHRELVRRARRPRARRRPQSRPQRARLPAQGDERTRRAQIARDARRSGAGQPVRRGSTAPPSRPASTRPRCSRRPAACSRSPASAARRRRRSRRRRRRCAARACSRPYAKIEQPADGRLAAARRRAGQQRRPARAAQGAAGDRAGAEGARRRTSRRCRPARATTRRSRSRGRR